jgi:exonuclease SbcC
MLKVAKEEKTDITNKINDLTDEIVGLSKSIKSIDEELIDLNLDELEKNKNEIQIKIQKSKDKIFELENRNIELGNQYNAIESEYAHIDIEKLEQNAVKEQEHADYNNLYTNKLERLLIELNNVQEKVDKLHNHKYDPECKYCIENEFVKDALSAKQTINQLYKEKDDIESLIKDNLIKSEPYNNSIMLLADYNSNKSSALKVRADILDIESKIKEFSIFEINATNKINEIESKIKNYNANKESIDFNKKISIEIQKLQDEKNTLSFKLLQLDESISNFTAQIKISDTVLKDAKEKIQRLNSLEQKFKAYELYTKATNRNGVPYNLISDILPQIESQANDILSYLVDFKIVLDTDGKSINIYITYDDDRTWALELASGMEKFISGIAIRNALLNYSNLPRPNFIAIDEGFGVLDSENMSALYNIFQYLKTQYKFILIISHIDALKDMAENQIEIYKDGGFSKVFF